MDFTHTDATVANEMVGYWMVEIQIKPTDPPMGGHAVVKEGPKHRLAVILFSYRMVSHTHCDIKCFRVSIYSTFVSEMKLS